MSLSQRLRQLCGGPATRRYVHCQEEEEEDEEVEGRGYEERGGVGQGAEEAGQTAEEGVGRLQAGRDADVLQRPPPPHLQGGEDPHGQAAEEANAVRLLLLLLLRSTSASPGPFPSQPDQRLHGDQWAGQEQHGAVHTAEE